MDLRRLTQNTGCRLLRGDALTEITSVCCDSRCAGPGALFVCLPGRHADGHDFAAQAVAAGAAAVLCTHDVPGLPAGVPCCWRATRGVPWRRWPRGSTANRPAP